LLKAKEKYFDVEGKEFVSDKERERQRVAYQLAIANGLPIKVTAASTSDALLLPITTAAAELVCSGVCEIVDHPAERLTRILIEEDSDSSSDEEHEGGDEEKEKVAQEGGFTRIQIDEDSDTEDEDEDEDEAVVESVEENSLIPTKVEETNESFVRIAITDDSDSDSDSDGDLQEESVSVEHKQKLLAEEALKAEANAAMQGGDLAKAIRLYGECVAIDGTSSVAIAAYGNRSLAHLKLEVCSCIRIIFE
jgi:hypothetical protein